MNVDLCRSQADALFCIHGFKHIINYLVDGPIELGDRLRDGAQAFIRETQNF